MTDQPSKTLVYRASDLRADVVRTFAMLARFGNTPEGLDKARRALSRCLSRAIYEPTPEEIRKGRNVATPRERWSFEYRRRLYQVDVRGDRAVRVVQVVKEGS